MLSLVLGYAGFMLVVGVSEAYQGSVKQNRIEYSELEVSWQGVLFHDRMKGRALEKIRGDLKKLEEEFAEANPDVPIQTIN